MELWGSTLEQTAAAPAREQRRVLADTATRLIWEHPAPARLGLGAELLAQSAHLWRSGDPHEDRAWAEAAAGELSELFQRPGADRARVLLTLSCFLDQLASGAADHCGEPGADPEP